MTKINITEFIKKLKSNNKPFLALASFMVSFTLFFGAIDFLIATKNDIWFKVGTLFSIFLIQLFVIFAILFAVGLLFKNKWRLYYGSLISAIGIAMYIQANYLSGSLNVFNGSENLFEYDKILTNLVLWIAIIAVFVLLCCFVKKWPKIAMLLFSFLILTQTLAIGINLLSYQKSTKRVTLTSNDITEIGNENIIVIMLDMMDQIYIEKLLETEPEFFNEFNGFTYYKNCTGMFQSTTNSLYYLLTGKAYHIEGSEADFKTQAYNSPDNYFNKLKEKYEIDLYTDHHDVAFNNDGMISNMKETEITALSKLRLGAAWYKITALRAFPVALKSYVKLNSADYNALYSDIVSAEDVDIYSSTNTGQVDFYNRLRKEGLKQKDNNLFKFIHLWGAHVPFSLSADVKEVESDNITYIDSVKGSFKIVDEYINQLKAIDKYDSSTIILMADHGIYNYNVMNPFLLVKQAGSTHEFNTSEAPVSWADFIPSVMSSAGMNENNKYGKAFWDVKEGEKRGRKFYFNFFENQPVFDMKRYEQIEFEIPDESNKIQHFNATGKVYGEYHVKELSRYMPMDMGSDIDLTTLDNKKYFDYGISTVDDSNTFSWGYSSQMSLTLNNWVDSDVDCEIKLVPSANKGQRLVVKSKDKIIYDSKELFLEEVVKFTIPADDIENGKVILKFEYPDAVCCITEVDSNNPFVVAFRFNSIKFN